MDWVETTGRTLEEAKRSALEQLGVGEPDAEIEVVAEPKIGLFGRVKEEGRVRARVKPRYPRSKGDRRDRKRGRVLAGQNQSGGAGPTTEPADGAATTATAERAPETRPPRPEVPTSRDDSPAPEHRGRRAEGATSTTGTPAPKQTSFDHVNVGSLQDQARIAEDFLNGLLSAMGATATISSTGKPDGIIEVAVNGEDIGALIGPKGTTLLALQEITRIVLQHHAPPSGYRVVVDVNGYRKRRQEALTRFTQQVAAEVVQTGTKRALEPMPAADRKVVHDAVGAIGGVTSISEGEEPNRRVVLVPDATNSNALMDKEYAEPPATP